MCSPVRDGRVILAASRTSTAHAMMDGPVSIDLLQRNADRRISAGRSPQAPLTRPGLNLCSKWRSKTRPESAQVAVSLQV